MTFDQQAYNLTVGLINWLTVFGLALIASVLIGASLSLVYGGLRAPGIFFSELGSGINDLFHTSPRRVYSLVTLTIREAIRRKALLVFVLFGVLLMFGGWFLTDTNQDAQLQVKVHVSAVLLVIAVLVILVMLILACWGIPEEIRNRSLHTVVTKPVRRSEIVLGRIIGFTAVGTIVLAAMSLVSYVWILRQVPESARGQLISRVPVYGELTFKDRQGAPADKGINVGDIWEFFSYIEGGTKGRGTWTFTGVTPALMVDASTISGSEEAVPRLVLESRFQAFRTYKGNMDRAILSQLVLMNDAKKLAVPLPPFSVREFGHNVTFIDRKISYYDDKEKKTREVDLFDDLAPEGVLKVEARCLDPGQFIGMARPGLFLRTPDKNFASGYFKAVFGIWMMMVLVIVLGVTASTFVKGPIAIVLTLSLLVVGTGFRGFLDDLVAGKVKGSGAIESAYRIVEHKNPMVALDPSAGVKVIQTIDKAPQAGLWIVSHIIPDYTRFWLAPYVANGFDVPFQIALLPAIATLLAYLVPCLLLGYFSLKLRELESK